MGDLAKDITEELKNQYSFKQHGNSLIGNCPQCGKKEAWTKPEKPFVIFCPRENQCGERFTARELFPHLFENFSQRFPATEQNPHAAAEAYLTQDRQFDIGSLPRNKWHQGQKRLLDGSYGETVRFPLWGEHYWERLFDRDTIEKVKGQRKAHFSYGITFKDGNYWSVKEWQPKAGEQLFIVEGIFHAIALHQNNKKAIAAFTCGCLPTQFINKHKGKGVVWCLAYDNGKAGRKACLKFKQQLQDMGETVQVHLCISDTVDWDEAYRKHLFSETFWQQCQYRGELLCADDIKHYAYIKYKHHAYNYSVLDYNNAIFGVKLNDIQHKLSEAEASPGTEKGYAIFRDCAEINKLSNVTLNFLYLQRDEMMNERTYWFDVHYENGSPSTQLSIDGSAVESPTTFNRILLTSTDAGEFEGSRIDLKILRQRWFKHITRIDTIPHLGYDPKSNIYVFNEQAVHNGRVISKNNQGYFKVGRKGIKSIRGEGIKFTVGKFNPVIASLIQKAWGNNGLVALAIWTQSLFAEQIKKQYKSLPFYELSGEPGAGKSTLIRNLWRCFGREGWEGFDPSKSRPAGRRRAMSSVSNLPVVLIEADREGEKPHHKGFDWNDNKTLYDYGGTLGTLGVAKRGTDTDDIVFRGMLVISQNAQVSGSQAILERIVHLHFTTGQQQTKHYVDQLDQLDTEQISGYMLHVLKQEKAYLQHYHEAYQQYSQRLYNESIKTSEVRLIVNHAQTLAAISCLRLFFNIDLATIDALYPFVVQRMKAREEMISGDHPLLKEFWETFHYLNQGGSICNEYSADNLLNHAKDTKTQIWVSLPHFEEQCRKYGQTIPDMREIKRLLPQCKSLKFQRVGKARSYKTGNTMHLWQFKGNQS